MGWVTDKLLQLYELLHPSISTKQNYPVNAMNRLNEKRFLFNVRLLLTVMQVIVLQRTELWRGLRKKTLN